MTSIKTVDTMSKCPCGFTTDQVISWNFSGKETTLPICRTCQKELTKSLLDKFI